MRTLAVATALVVAALLVWFLREATISRRVAVAPDSRIELVVRGRQHLGEPDQDLAERVEAVILTCRIETGSDLVGGISPLEGSMFRAVLAPSMDRTDQRQFRGCLEDWLVDGVLLDVEVLEPL